MPLKRWKKLASEYIAENPWWRYRKDHFEIEPGKRGEYHCVSTPGSALIVPITPAGKLLLVEQYRFLADRFSVEFPCGGMAVGELPSIAAARELAEETGYRGRLTPLGEFNPMNGVTDEVCHVYRADALAPLLERAQGDDTESFLLHELDFSAFEARVADGTVWDGMTLAAYALFRARA